MICRECNQELRLVSFEEHVNEVLKDENDKETRAIKAFSALVSYGQGYFVCESGHKNPFYQTFIKNMLEVKPLGDDIGKKE